MTKTINSDLIRGNINTIILKALYSGDRYGYDIIKEIEDKSHGQYILKQPTLYSCLKRLESQGFISSYWDENANSNGGRRKYYTLTDLGREVFVKNQDEYEYSRTIIDQLISERDYDLDNVENPSNDDIAKSEQVNDEDKFVVDATPDIDLDDTIDDDNGIDQQTIEIDETINEDQDDITQQTCSIDEDAQTNKYCDAEVGQNKFNDDEVSEENNEDCGDTQTDSILSADYFGYDPSEFEPVTKESATSDEIDAILSGLDDKRSYSDTINTPTSATTQKQSFCESYLADSSNSDLFQQNNQASEDQQYRFSIDESNSTESADPLAAASQSEATNITTIESSSAASTQKNLTSKFLSYDTELPYNVTEDYKQNKTSDDNYQILLKGFVSDYDTHIEAEKSQEKIISNEPIPEDSLSVKEKIQVRNFGKLSQSIRDLGDEVKIRTPDSSAAHEYNKQYYYYRNKLLLFQYGILFVIMLLESFISFISIKTSISVDMPYAVALYVCSILFCLAFPITAGILYLSDPYKRKRIDFNFKNSMIFRTIIMLQLILIIYSINVYCGMPIGGSSEYILSMVLPCILATNVPISSIIFNCLYRSKNFAVK